MGVWLTKFLRNRESTSGNIAKGRLKMVLIHDRLTLSPGLLAQIQGDMGQVIARYMEIDRERISLTVSSHDRCSHLTAQVPVIGAIYK